MRAWTSLVVVLVCCGCGSEPKPAALNDDLILQLSKLPRAKQSPLVALREEVARLEQEGTTPELLSSETTSNVSRASFFVELFKEDDLPRVAEDSDQLLPRPTYRAGPIELEKLHRFRQRYDAQRQQARSWANTSPEPIKIDFRRGWFIDATFVDAAAICIRLEMLHAVEQLAANDLNASAEAWESAMILCEQLAGTPWVTARLAAVHMRADLLQLLGAIVRADEVDHQLASRLAARVKQTLNRWPTEAELWKSERAVGMHAYEIVRAGHLMLVLTPQEVAQFADEQILRDLEAAARRSVDADQLFYLESMRRVIASCPGPQRRESPYYLRAAVVRDILEKLDAKRKDSDFPLIAGRLLLPEVAPTQQLLAIDRARCEAWLLALAQATGASHPGYERSPVTGDAYQVQVDEHRVTIHDFVGTHFAAEPAVIVPRFDVRVGRLP